MTNETIRRRRRFACLLSAAALACSACGKNNDVGGNSTSPDPDAATDAGDMSPGTPDMGGDETDGGGDASAGDMAAPPDAAADVDVGVDMSSGGYTDPTGASGTRLRRWYLAGDDGAYMTMGFRDTDLDVECSFRTATDGELRCLPDFLRFRSLLYADSDCTEPVIRLLPTLCDVQWAADGDGEFYVRTDTPAVLSGGNIYRADGDSCDAVTTTDQSEHWVAEPVPAEDFVLGSLVDESRDGAMVSRYVEGDDGSRMLLETVHQTLGYPCQFDEESRCLPPAPFSRRYFLDAGCTTPVYHFPRSEPPPVITIRETDDLNCTTGVTYHRRGAEEFAVNVYVLDNTGSCVVEAAPIDTLHRLGPEIALADFPQGMTQIEGDGPLAARRHVDTAGAPLGTVDDFWQTDDDAACDPYDIEDAEVACVPKKIGFVEPGEYPDSMCMDELGIGIIVCDTAPDALVNQLSPSCEVPGLSRLADVWETGAAAGPDYYYKRNDAAECEARTYSERVSAYGTGPSIVDSLPTVSVGTE